MKSLITAVGALAAIRGCYVLLYQDNVLEAVLLAALAGALFLASSETSIGGEDENN